MRQPTTASTTLADIVQIVACILQQNGASRGGPEQVPPIILTGISSAH